MNHFAEWLSHTSFSLAIQTHEWIIPTIQSIHIVAIGIVLYFVTRELLYLLTLAAFIAVGIAIAAVVRRR